MADLTNNYAKYLTLAASVVCANFAIADNVVARPEIKILPALIRPDANRVIRFSVGVSDIAEPGLSSFALDLEFSGPINLVQTIQNQSASPIPADKITCAAGLNSGSPSETIIQTYLCSSSQAWAIFS
ncbi:hypothetical protein [Methylomonas koyamae]|uniref:hypothetical protein n=1 Tax=Methylomonas koyamae TaxID=702114 RepID=UPI0006CF9C3B|nr:hypothetical protein [Methylomonas koyamae]